MLDCLKIDAYAYEGSTKKDYYYWINGKDLLQLAQYAIDGINTTGFDPPGDGSYDRPWKLDGKVRTWLNTAKKIRSYTRDEKYFYICGRFVKKAGGYYMVDGGGDDGAYGYEPRTDRRESISTVAALVPQLCQPPQIHADQQQQAAFARGMV